MTSPVTKTLNDAGKWEVRTNDDSRQLLGTFEDTTGRDIFVEAVEALAITGEVTAALPYEDEQKMAA